MKRHYRYSIAAGLTAGLAAITCAAGAQTPDADIPQLKSFVFQKDGSLVDRIGLETASARRTGGSAKAHVAALLASVVASDATFDAKEFACRQLVFVAGPTEVKTLVAAAKDPALAQYAVGVLANIPGKAVNDAVIAALPTLPTDSQFYLVKLLAERNDARAAATLTYFMMGANLERASSAAASLARISGPSAHEVLVAAFKASDEKRKPGLGAALILRAGRLAAAGNSADAAQLYSICDASGLPMLRAAALRGRAASNPSGSASLVLAALKENGTPRQSMAADILRTSSNPTLRSQVGAALPALTPHTQTIVLKALEDQGERADWPGIRGLASNGTGEVKLAAIEALGKISTPSALPVLLKSAASGSAAEKLAAQDSICRLRGAEVDAGLRAALLNGSTPGAIRQISAGLLARRRAVSAFGDISSLLGTKDEKLRAACYAALRDSGPASLLPTVLAHALTLPADARDNAIEACVEIARRGTTEAERTGPLLTALDAAKQPADKLTLLTVLNQVGGLRALMALKKAYSSPTIEVREGALALLSEWPTEEPLELLLKAAKSGLTPRTKAIGLRGYLKMIAANEQRAPEKTLALLNSIAPEVTRPEDKRQILSAIAKVHSIDALRFVSGYLKQDGVQSEAESAAVEIGRTTASAFPDETAAILGPIASSSSDDAVKAAASAALAAPAKAAGFITAWELSAQYTRDGADYKTLFDVVFPPETAGSAAGNWRLMTPITNAEQPWLMDILAVYPGEQKVAYMQTAVNAPADLDVTLDLGSDDGIKAWVNGALVLTDNTARAAAPGEEKVQIHLKQGWNTLMLKVTQNVMGWGACARLIGADGNTPAGLKYSVPSANKAR